MGKEKVTRIFQMNTDTALLFFTIIKWSTDHGVKDTLKFRQYVLNWLAKEDKMDRVYDTKRSESEVIKGFQKQGYNIDDRRLQRTSLWQKIKTILGL